MKTIPFLTVALMAVTLSMNTAFAQNRYAAGAGTESVSQAGRPARPERKPLTDEQRIEQRVQKMQRRLLLDEGAACLCPALYGIPPGTERLPEGLSREEGHRIWSTGSKRGAF